MNTFSSVPVAGVEARPFIDGGGEIRQLALLAPTPAVFPSTFRQVVTNPAVHSSLLKQMQRLRGEVYLDDGAIQPADLDETGCHVMPADSQGVHVLALNQQGKVVGCSRFLLHHPDICFEQLAVARSPLARDPILGVALRAAVSAHLASARERGYLYFELGGWALHPSIRHSTEAVRIAALNFSLGLALGGAAAICTATVRNHSAMILRRIGGRPLSCNGFTIPPYYDPRYQCEIEVLAFDSDLIPERHAPRVQQLRATLNDTPVLCNQSSSGSSLIRLYQAIESETRVPSHLAAA